MTEIEHKYSKWARVEVPCPECSETIITTFYEFSIAALHGHYVLRCDHCLVEFQVKIELRKKINAHI